MRHPQLWVMPSTILLWQTSSYNPETSTALSYTVNNSPLTNIKLQSWDTLGSELYPQQFSCDKHQATTPETPSAQPVYCVTIAYSITRKPFWHCKPFTGSKPPILVTSYPAARWIPLQLPVDYDTSPLEKVIFSSFTARVAKYRNPVLTEWKLASHMTI